MDAVEQAFGADVDYGQIVKSYSTVEGPYTPERKYSQPEFVSIDKYAVIGDPDMEQASTSYVERLNATTQRACT